MRAVRRTASARVSMSTPARACAWTSPTSRRAPRSSEQSGLHCPASRPTLRIAHFGGRMYRLIMMAAVTAAMAAAAGCSGATARLSLANQTVAPAANAQALLADGTSLRLKIISVSLAQDVDPETMDNIGEADNI